jgi:hypothetical protein
MLASIKAELASQFENYSYINFVLRYSFFIITLYILTKSLYTLYLSPLSTYPGPTLHALSAVPLTYQRITGSIISHLSSLHSQYGPIVRIGPTELSYIDPSAWKDIYGLKTNTGGQMPKDPAFYDITPESRVSNVATDLSDESHARQRKVFSHAFSERALRKQEGLVARYVNKLVERLNDIARAGEEVDLVRMLNFTTFDIMSDLAFGEPLDLLE